MKISSHHSLLLAAAMLAAGSANAQGPTNQLNHTPTAPSAPTAPGGPNAFTVPNGGASYSQSRGSYSQDSYVSQVNTSNYATVSQVDNRLGIITTNNGGSSAAIDQTGSYNNAYQSQTLDNTSVVPRGADPNNASRNEMRSIQAGDRSQSQQTQVGGLYTTALVRQEAGSSANSAVQVQTSGSGLNIYKSASITQAGSSSGNSASQTQSGDYQQARIVQQGRASVAAQTQQDVGNSADILQGARGSNNTAIQLQSGTRNNARIVQSDNSFPPRLGYSSPDYNYAKQTQSGTFNQADIAQRSFGGYAEQVQSGTFNAARITQGVDSSLLPTAASAAYTIQSGTNNSVTISQR